MLESFTEALSRETKGAKTCSLSCDGSWPRQMGDRNTNKARVTGIILIILLY